MKVKELIEKLNSLNPEANVFIDIPGKDTGENVVSVVGYSFTDNEVVYISSLPFCMDRGHILIKK